MLWYWTLQASPAVVTHAGNGEASPSVHLFTGRRISFSSEWGTRTSHNTTRIINKKQKTLQRLAGIVNLPADSYDYGGGAGGPKGPAMTSSLVLPWLVYKWRWSESSKTLISPMIRTWLQHAAAGLHHLPEGGAYYVVGRFFTSLRDERVIVDKATATVPN